MFAKPTSNTPDKTTPTPTMTTAATETIIGKTVTVEGDLKCDDNVLVDGTFIGTITTSKTITVGTDAHIQGNLHAADIIVAGDIQGNLMATGNITLHASAQLHGDIETATVRIEQGAVMHGKCESGQARQTGIQGVSARVANSSVTAAAS